MGLIISARFWNDIEWLQASLDHIDAWDAEHVIISEGNWDQEWPARSTDGTRELIEAYAAARKNVTVIDNIREDKNYRVNQANTSNLAMKIAAAKPNQDWMLIIDVDHFYFSEAIQNVKRVMEENENDFDYFSHNTFCFFYDLQHCEIRKDSKGTKLPYKLLPGCIWRPTNHLTVDGKMYHQIREARERFMPTIDAMHYEGLREKHRLADKYSIGNRKSFDVYQDGKRLRGVKAYCGNCHPCFAEPVLKKMGLL